MSSCRRWKAAGLEAPARIEGGAFENRTQPLNASGDILGRLDMQAPKKLFLSIHNCLIPDPMLR